MLPVVEPIGIENFVSEIEEDFWSEDSQDREDGKKIFSLSKFSKMFNRLYADQ